MRTLISAAVGALALVASPASAQFYKAGTVTATPRVEQPDRAVEKHRNRPAVPPFYKAGTTNFMLQPPITRADARRPSDAPSPASADATSCDCHDKHAGPNPAS